MSLRLTSDSDDLLRVVLCCGFLRCSFVGNSSCQWGPMTVRKEWVGKRPRMEDLLAEAVTIDGRMEWYCRFCSETNVWTRSMCRRYQTSIPSVLQGKYKQAVSTKVRRSWSESSSSGERARPSGSRRQSCANCATRFSGTKVKEGHSGCRPSRLVRKAGLKKMRSWKWMKNLTV